MKYVADESYANVNKHESSKPFKRYWVRKISDSDKRTDKDSRQGSNDYSPGQGPYHSSFFYITIHSARNGNNVEQVVGGTHSRRVKVEEANLKGKQHEGT